MIFDLKEDEVFIPNFAGNKKLTESDQIQIEWRLPNVKAKKRVSPAPVMQFEYSASGDYEKTKGEIKHDAEAMIREMTVKIVNCQYKGRDGKVASIETAKELFEAPGAFSPLVIELERFYIEKLKEVDETEKN